MQSIKSKYSEIKDEICAGQTSEKNEGGLYYVHVMGENVLTGVDRSIDGVVSIPFGTSIIGDGAFRCSRITSITIPGSVRYIGRGAFDGCSNLTSVSLPQSVEAIGPVAFDDCDSLREVRVPRNADYDFTSFPGGCKVIRY